MLDVLSKSPGVAEDLPLADLVDTEPVYSLPSRGTPEAPKPRQLSTRHRRPALIAFVTDAASETALFASLAHCVQPAGP